MSARGEESRASVPRVSVMSVPSPVTVSVSVSVPSPVSVSVSVSLSVSVSVSLSLSVRFVPFCSFCSFCSTKQGGKNNTVSFSLTFTLSACFAYQNKHLLDLFPFVRLVQQNKRGENQYINIISLFSYQNKHLLDLFPFVRFVRQNRH